MAPLPGPDPACKACDDSGLVAPSPVLEDLTPWPAYLLAAEVARATKGHPLSSCAVASGRLRPRPCPRCNAGGLVEGNPWDLQRLPEALRPGALVAR